MGVASVLAFCFIIGLVPSFTLGQQGTGLHRLHRIVRRQAGSSPSQSGVSGRGGTVYVQTGSGSGLSISRRPFSSQPNVGSQREFVSPNGQPYYQYQPHVSTSRSSGSGYVSSSSSVPSSSSSSGVYSSSPGIRSVPSGRVVSVVNGSIAQRGQTYAYPFGGEQVQYQHVSSQNGTGPSRQGGYVSGVSTSYYSTQLGGGSRGGGSTGQGAGSRVVGVRNTGSRVMGSTGSRGVEEGNTGHVGTRVSPGSTGGYGGSRGVRYGHTGSRVVGSTNPAGGGGSVRTSTGQAGSGVASTGGQGGSRASTRYGQATRWRVVPGAEGRRHILANRRSRLNGSQGSRVRGQAAGQVPGARPATGFSGSVRNRGGGSAVVGGGTGGTGISGGGSVGVGGGGIGGGSSRRVYVPTGTHYTRTQTGGHQTSVGSQSGSPIGSQSGARQTVFATPVHGRPGYRATLQQVNSGSVGTRNTGTGTSVTGYRRTYQSGSTGQTHSQGYPRYTAQTTGSQTCPETGIDLRINGLTCQQAVQQHGTFLCYTHEYTSRQCCETCLPRRQSNRRGCEYGDHSSQCSAITAADCYDLRTRQTCCQSCERFRLTNAPVGCEYGDMTGQCGAVRSNPGLCYIPDNQRLCCNTCHGLRSLDTESCPWGDFNQDLCQLFDQGSSRVRINCYSAHRRRLCCRTCERLRAWLPQDLPADCRYGDRPVVFNTDQFGQLNCTTLFQHFSSTECQTNQAVSVNCCFTCHRLVRHQQLMASRTESRQESGSHLG